MSIGELLAKATGIILGVPLAAGSGGLAVWGAWQPDSALARIGIGAGI